MHLIYRLCHRGTHNSVTTAQPHPKLIEKMAKDDVQMIDADWLLCQAAQAHKEYTCIAYIFQNCDGEACQKLHECCGHNTLHSLKLKVFIQAFCQSYMEITEVFGLDTQLAPDSSVFTCDDPSACVLKILDQCDREGWLLKTSCYKWDDFHFFYSIKRLAAELQSGFVFILHLPDVAAELHIEAQFLQFFSDS